jgi:hypothetical protein
MLNTAFTECLRYTREITIPATVEKKQWRLIMERTKPSTLWIDGDSISHSSVLLSPQIYTVGNLSAGKHIIRIEIDNSATSVPQGIHGSHAWTDATQTNWNGIIGKFGLEANEGICMENIQVYPSVSSTTVRATARIQSFVAGKCKIKINGYTWNTAKEMIIPEQYVELDLEKGLKSYSFNIDRGKHTVLWSEFDPALYKVHFELMCEDIKDYCMLDFGIRDFETKDTQFTVNSLKTFLRGKHDACVFPLTGYPPMTKEEWIRQFRIAKQYGINHYRFHSWTPPQAAFDAANEEGIYMQAELPYWGTMDRKNVELNAFLIREGEQILASYGNNPSFVMMALGNELGGDPDFWREMVNGFKKSDNRRLYAFGSNNWLGTGGQQAGEDFFVTCRVGGQVGSDDYSMHTRASFSFADAKAGGYLNGRYPSTDVDFVRAVAACSVPVISHENGQFQVYPDYDEIRKYQGVLYPFNLEIFRKRLEKNGLQSQAKDFHKAAARFSALCYKADIEMCLRTPGFGGFQLLDLQDYPGQGSAYIGILDAFMDNKGGITAEEFKGFCSEIVAMAVMPKYCWSNDESLVAAIKVCNYSNRDLSNRILEWSLSKANDKTTVAGGKFALNIRQGTLADAGQINIPLNKLTDAVQLRLTLKLENRVNGYDIWVYPNENKILPAGNAIVETNSLNEAIESLKQGGNVLYIPDHSFIEKNSVGGMFTPDYWNYAMFRSISESLHRDVSPGTLSILTHPQHPLFKEFPTDFCSNWQWWIITKNSRPYMLDKTPADYKPLVQVVDNIERNHKLGLLFEMRVGEGKLLVCMCDLKAIAGKPEGRQFRKAIFRYMSSSDFAPETVFTIEKLKELFDTGVVEQKITGVKNSTDYR